MYQYLDLLKDIMANGIKSEDRTGTGTISVFGRQLRFNLQDGFPLVTTKKVHTKSIIVELLWFLKGYTNTKYLTDRGVTIWNEWADENGELGPIYGNQWRAWREIFPSGSEVFIDQLAILENDLRENPRSRRHIVSAWNVGRLREMALPPCHLLFQCYVIGNRLSLQVYQRSVDVFLGLPFNIASYALLLSILALRARLVPHELIMSLGDTHLYLNHIEQAQEQLRRYPMKLPILVLSKDVLYYKHIEDIETCDIDIIGYNSHPVIKAPISI